MRVAGYAYLLSTVTAVGALVLAVSLPERGAAQGLSRPAAVPAYVSKPTPALASRSAAEEVLPAVTPIALSAPARAMLRPQADPAEPDTPGGPLPSEDYVVDSHLVLLDLPDVPPTRGELCAMLEAEANVRSLPSTFFVRLIWQESRFNAGAVSPKGAQGIAQFMPATAQDRGLDDPFDPVQALAASAELLTDLAQMFGNVGLAAAAYNAGPGRVQRWLDGETTLPAETLNYVKIITGLEADDWKGDEWRTPEVQLPASLRPAAGSVQDWCRSLPSRPIKRAPTLVVEAKADATIQSKSKHEADDGAWRVQLAANYSKSKAKAALDRLRKKHPKLFAEHEPKIARERASARGRKALYEVRVAVDTRAAADALCSQLKKSGGACTVAMN
jgi:hypothetical protein